MPRIRSYRSKLQAAFVVLGLAAIAITGWESSQDATAALRRATYDRLNAIAETKARTIERYFEDASNHVLALSTDESTIAALEEFQRAWETVPPLRPGSDRDRALHDVYQAAFSSTATPDEAPGLAAKWMPDDRRARSLQSVFLVENPYPARQRSQLLMAQGLGRYGEVHARYHPTLHRYQSAFGFYDIFLIDADDGRILYTVLKETDLGASLGEPPYSNTTLGRAFKRALDLGEPESYVVEDYAPYAASQFAPAAFVAAPIWRRGSKIGVLAIQISVDHVNRVMTSDRKWKDEGLGDTGQSYIVGPDRTLRSDVRYEIERPNEFYRRLEEAGVAKDAIDRMRRYRTAILNLRIPDEVPETARRGQRGTHAGRDLRGVEVLRSYVPLAVPGLNWNLIAEIEAAEALAPVRALQRKILFWAVLIACLFFVAASFLARSVTRPVLALADKAERLGRRDFDARVDVESKDEIGMLAAAFNRMVEDLRATTVSKAELEVLTGRLITAQEEERTRIGRELHDDLTQRLAALAIELGKLQRTLPSEQHRAEIARVRRQVIELSEEVHGLSRRLHPAMLDDLGLAAVIESECRAFFERGGPPVELAVEGSFESVPKQTQVAVYRIIQEALRNVQRHSGAEEVNISLRRSTAGVDLEIRDSGRGFNRQDPQWRRGLGLASMEERARLLGGQCTIRSMPGQGTSIQVSLPVGDADAETKTAAGR